MSASNLFNNQLRHWANNQDPNSLANKFRKKRFDFFLSLFSQLPKPVKVLDLGGTEEFWEQMNLVAVEEIQLTLLNLTKSEVKYPNFISILGDARDLSQFGSNQFDIVFSNSVIEHVGNFEDQQKMAKETQRVGKRFFIQTPNYNFPLEPHFLVPFFQFLPLNWKKFLVKHWDLGWCKKAKSEEEALMLVNSIRLLTLKELKQLFPDGKVFHEKFLGISKSFVIYDGKEWLSS